MQRRLLIEGWRFVPHSYALVAQSHCLCLVQREAIDLRFADLPYFGAKWRRTRGIFAKADEERLAAIPPPEPAFAPEVTFTLRPERPDFSSPHSGRRFAFGTAEYRVLKEDSRSGLTSGPQVPQSVSVVTPSQWSALAYARFGLPSARIHVVPHGIDPAHFHPDPAARSATRETLGLQRGLVCLSMGAMTWNKGLDVLLAAFARVAETEPEARLVLKGADALYPSRSFVGDALAGLSARARETVANRLVYIGETYASRRIADLLRAADVYVSPYRAEGFNLPVLEAAACGIPVICTAGGPTDEFTREPFAWRIRSTLMPYRFTATESGDYLEPDVDHLVELMRKALRHPEELAPAGAAGAAYAAENLTWEHVTERLLEVLFGSGG